MPEVLQGIVIVVASLIPCAFEIYVVVHKRRANERTRLDVGTRLPLNDRFARDAST